LFHEQLNVEGLVQELKGARAFIAPRGSGEDESRRKGGRAKR
jgi:hypothetical protein